MKAVKFQINATKTRVLMVDTCFGSVRELTLVGILRVPLSDHFTALSAVF